MAEELNQMAMQLRYFEEQAQTLEQNISLLQATIGNMEATLMTLGNLKDAKPNQEIMIKVGKHIGKQFIVIYQRGWIYKEWL